MEFPSFLFCLQWMNWILHLNIFFNIFLNLIFILLFFTRLQFMITSQLIFKEFSISQCWKFLTQFHILILTEMITSFIKISIFCFSKSTSKIFSFQHWSSLRCLCGTLIIIFTSQLRYISISTYFCTSPRIDLVFICWFSLFRRNVVSFKRGTRFRWNLLSFSQLFFLGCFFYTFCTGFLRIFCWEISLTRLISRYNLLFFLISSYHLSSIGIGQKILFLFIRIISYLLNSFLSFKTLVFL